MIKPAVSEEDIYIGGLSKRVFDNLSISTFFVAININIKVALVKKPARFQKES